MQEGSPDSESVEPSCFKCARLGTGRQTEFAWQNAVEATYAGYTVNAITIIKSTVKQ